jgi:hypothetical protein
MFDSSDAEELAESFINDDSGRETVAADEPDEPECEKCDRDVKVRHFPKPDNGIPANPEAPEREVVCLIHGIQG